MKIVLNAVKAWLLGAIFDIFDEAFIIVFLRKLSCFLYAVFTCLVGWSQQPQSNYLPDYYSSSFTEFQALLNPAFTNRNSQERASLNVLHKSRSGILGEVANTTAYADALIKPDQRLTQVARVLFQNEQEGPYISAPRFYGNYALRIPIREDLSLAAGAGLGMSSLNFSASSGTGSATVFDGNAGGIVQFRKTEVGVSAYQIFNNSSIAISSSILFKRFYQLYFQSEKELTESVTVRAIIFWRPQPLADVASMTGVLSYKEIISIGAAYHVRRGTSFLTSLRLNKSGNPFLINFSYNTLFLSSLLATTNSFELGLQFRVRKN